MERKTQIKVALIGAAATIIAALTPLLMCKSETTNKLSSPTVSQPSQRMTTSSQSGNAHTEYVGRDKTENNNYYQMSDTARLIPARSKSATVNHNKGNEPVINQTVNSNNQQGGQTANEINNYSK